MAARLKPRSVSRPPAQARHGGDEQMYGASNKSRTEENATKRQEKS
jgi:hypothetical protein